MDERKSGSKELTSSLKNFAYNIYKCTSCGICRAKYSETVRRVCPSREFAAGFEHHFARGRIAIARAILEGRLRYSMALSDALGSCTTCGNCREQCGTIDPKTGALVVDTPRIIEAMREDLAESGLLLEKQKVLISRIEENGNPYGEPAVDRLSWASNLDVPRKADLMLFVGCTSSYRRQEIASATASILKKLGVQFGISREEVCCGSPLFRTGSKKAGRKLVDKNIKALGVGRKVVTACPGCYKTLKDDYPRISGNLPFEVFHITEYLDQMLRSGKISFRNRINKRATYHDPCHLGRHMGVYEPPRRLLEAMPGIEFTEMYPTKANTFCCGAGGGVKITFPEIALESANYRMGHVQETGADTVVSACPFCKTNLSDSITKGKNSIECYDITELIDRAI